MIAAHISEVRAVNRVRCNSRLRECAGLAMALHRMTDSDSDVPAHAVEAIANGLLFALERLCEEHGLSPDGRPA